jgi:Mn-dependent DtxR family transcriptional regulator
MSLDKEIQSIIHRTAAEIAQAVRQDLAAQVRKVVGRNGAAVSKPGPKPKAAKGGGRKRRGVDEKSLETIYQYVAKNPGKRSEEIQKSAGISPAMAKKAIIKLREGGRLKMKGEKRAATYTAA